MPLEDTSSYQLADFMDANKGKMRFILEEMIVSIPVQNVELEGELKLVEEGRRCLGGISILLCASPIPTQKHEF